jgi:HD-GYP domain-containing protein (c-di-GMP phosphodiesterase class II)
MAYKLLCNIDVLEKEANVILSHHERVDGLGYPNGLKSNKIDILARILSICDSYDAMISERPYRKPLSTVEAAAELERHSGSQFDSELVSLFIKYINSPVHKHTRRAPKNNSKLKAVKM